MPNDAIENHFVIIAQYVQNMYNVIYWKLWYMVETRREIKNFCNIICKIIRVITSNMKRYHGKEQLLGL